MQIANLHWKSEPFLQNSVNETAPTCSRASVYWASKEQLMVQQSAEESKIAAHLFYVRKELWLQKNKMWFVWFRTQKSLDVVFENTVGEDNQICTADVRSDGFSEPSVHIDLENQLVVHCVRQKRFRVEFLASENKVVKIVTKIIFVRNLVSLRGLLRTE